MFMYQPEVDKLAIMFGHKQLPVENPVENAHVCIWTDYVKIYVRIGTETVWGWYPGCGPDDSNDSDGSEDIIEDSTDIIEDSSEGEDEQGCACGPDCPSGEDCVCC